jgi:heme-degrading monooxygenase HmoA
MTPNFANTPEPPYFVVVFTSQRKGADQDYEATAAAMATLAAAQPGYIGVESAHDANGFGITAVYFTDEESILAWRNNARHKDAQRLGRERWYEHYEVRVARVERAYSGPL